MPANQTWRGCHSPKCPWYLCVFPMTGSPVQFMTNATEQTEQTASEICSPVGGRNQSLPIFALYYNLLGVMRVWEIWAIWQSLGCRGIDGRGSTLKNIPCHLQLFNPCRHSAIHSISLHSPHSAALFPSQAPCFHAPVFFARKSGLCNQQGMQQDMPPAMQVPYEARLEDVELHHWCTSCVPNVPCPLFTMITRWVWGYFRCTKHSGQ